MQPRCQAEKEGKHTQPARGSSGDRWERERKKGRGKDRAVWARVDTVLLEKWCWSEGTREGGLNGGAGGMDVIYRA